MTTETWSLQDAKNRFSAVVEAAMGRPTTTGNATRQARNGSAGR